MTTVRDILTAALPPDTQVVAGEAGLGREVTWATGPKPTPPAFAHVKGQEIVLLEGGTLATIDERMTLEKAIRQLAERNISAVAYQGNRIGAAAVRAAEETGVALLQLPGSADLATLEREMAHLITERRQETQRRGHEIGRRLMELAIAGETLPVILRALAELACHSVALEARDGRLIGFQQGPAGPDRERIEPLLTASRQVAVDWLRLAAASSPVEPPVAVHPLDGRWHRVVAPVIARDGLLGNLSLIVPAKHPTSTEETLTSRGAAACAIVMAREYATLAARREIELSVLDEIFDGALRSELTLLQQAKRLGHDLQAPHVVFVLRFDSSGATTVARSHENRWPLIDDLMARSGPKLLWRKRHNAAELLWPVAGAAEARAVAASIHDELARRLTDGGAALSIGAGRVNAGLVGIQQSHQEAKQALAIGRRLSGPGYLTHFEDLGVYRLIFAAEQLPELREFHDEALGPLIAYDREHGGDLIRTLTAFFDANGGPKEAAGLLGVHRNTVLYRLDRIRAISGVDLDDADVRLRLHLALSIHLALYAADG